MYFSKHVSLEQFYHELAEYFDPRKTITVYKKVSVKDLYLENSDTRAFIMYMRLRYWMKYNITLHFHCHTYV